MFLFWFGATLKPTSVQHSYNKSVFRTSKAPHYYNTKNIREKCRQLSKLENFNYPTYLYSSHKGQLSWFGGIKGPKEKVTAKRNEDVDEKKRAWFLKKNQQNILVWIIFSAQRLLDDMTQSYIDWIFLLKGIFQTSLTHSMNLILIFSTSHQRK